MFTKVIQRKPPLNGDMRIQKQDGRQSRVQGASRMQKGRGALFPQKLSVKTQIHLEIDEKQVAKFFLYYKINSMISKQHPKNKKNIHWKYFKHRCSSTLIQLTWGGGWGMGERWTKHNPAKQVNCLFNAKIQIF